MNIPDTTLTEFVLEHAGSRGAKPALADAATGRVLSYADLAAAVHTTAAGLAGQGVRPGDVLALCAPNGIEFVLTLYAATSAGATVATVNPQWTSEEIGRLLRATGARWLVSTPDLVEQKPLGTMTVERTFLIRDGAVVLDAPEPIGPPGGAISRSAGSGPKISPDVALLLSSSGTTGLPKSVMLSHRGVVADLCQVRHAHPVTQDDVVLAALPLYHIFAMQASLNLPLRQGATVVILPRFEFGAFLRAIQDHTITRTEAVPPMVLALASRPEVADYDLSSLQMIMCAAAPLGAELARACTARVGCRIKQAFGMTETSGGTHIALEDGPDRPDRIQRDDLRTLRLSR